MQIATTALLLALGAAIGAAQKVEIHRRPIETAIKININGKLVETPLVTPLLMDGRVMVPLRGVLQEFDANIEWYPNQKIVVARRAGRSVTLPVGRNYAFVGDKFVDLAVPAQIMNGRTLVPLRFVAEALNAYVFYDATARTVVITSRIESGDGT